MTTGRTKSWSRQRAAMKAVMDDRCDLPPSKHAELFAASEARRVIRRNRIIGWAFGVFPLTALALVIWHFLRHGIH